MVNGSARYSTANAFRRALEDRLKQEVKKRGRPLEELRREFLFQRFLTLVFSVPDSRWVLKGGAGLLMRLAEARSSKDLDLLHLGEVAPSEAIAELRQLTIPRQGDLLTFVIGDAVAYSKANPVVELAVTSYIGSKYGSFSIDLAAELHLLSTPEGIRPKPVVELPGLSAPPEIAVYALTDQVADKVCAMYEPYGDRRLPSSRYRDLIDLALIVSTWEFDGTPLSRALRAESKRRRMELPGEMVSPAPNWPAGYRAYARKAKIDESLQDINVALERVGACLNPLLGGSHEYGRWIPGSGWSG